jgi:superfamily I DNA and RNA helicase
MSDLLKLAVLNEFRGDFEFVPPLGTTVEEIGKDLLSLTAEQYQVLDQLSENPRIVIRGGAGTGKTVLAMEEARRQSDAGKRVLLVCYNRNLGAYLRTSLDGHCNLDIWHLHGLMENTISRAGAREKIPKDLNDTDVMEVIFPSLSCEAINELQEAGKYDVLIIDEGQDVLMPRYLDFLDMVLHDGLNSGVWRIFIDRNQNLFENASSSGLDRIMQGNPALTRLTVNCRNTEPVAVATGLLSGIIGEKTLIDKGPSVGYKWYSDDPDSAKLIAEAITQLINDGLNPGQIVILSRFKLENSSVASVILENRLNIGTWEGPQPGNGQVRFSTIGAFKGLESDAVLLVDVKDLSDPIMNPELYVGSSRARTILQVFMNISCESDYKQKAFDYGRALSSLATEHEPN